MPNSLVAVVGSGGSIKPDIAQCAEEVGALIAERGWVLVTGGKGGVMEAASRGGAQAGGTVLGILPDSDATAANAHVHIPIATGVGEARNAIIATACHGMIAVGGEYGTLSEIALARKFDRPVVLLNSPWTQVGDTPVAQTPEEAVQFIAEHIG